MESSNITWYAKTELDEGFIRGNNIFAGTYNKKHELALSILLWNNRYGLEDVKDLDNFYIKVSFEHAEDSVLLPYLSFIINDSYETKAKPVDGYAVLSFPMNITLSGRKNDGTLKDNESNYMLIDVIFKAPDEMALKPSDLKTLYFEIMKK